jgi:hypothetical protein
MRCPGDDTPPPPGGRAAERLREMLKKRFPQGTEPEGTLAPEDTPEAGKGAEGKDTPETRGCGDRASAREDSA